ncbi:MAG: magnesium transporter [Trichodesmium sp. MO_231.B1]|nr:magnesium transporter [Trichodesmium sp. MO_231.B1]
MYTSHLSSQATVYEVRTQLQNLIAEDNLAGIKNFLAPVQPTDIAEAIELLPEDIQLVVFRLLGTEQAIAVYEQFDPSTQKSLSQQFRHQEIRDIVNKMSPDDRAQLFDELPPKLLQRLNSELSPREREATSLLLGYQPDTAGRIMTPEYVSLESDDTVAQSLERIRSLADVSETIYYLYITDAQQHLVGILSLRELVTASPEQTISAIMNRDVVSVHTNTDQEEVVRVIQHYDLIAVPVVDKERRLVGIITVDDVIDIVQEETTEDIYKLSGVQSEGDDYFQVNLLAVTKKRVFWLLVLLLTNTFTSKIITSQEEVLEKVVGLAAFIPLLNDTGGNVGSQSSTVIIRGFSTDEIGSMGNLQVIIREGIAGSLLGLMLGIVAIIWAYILQQNLAIAFVVGISLFAITIIASVAGAALPFIFRLLKLDPALMSAPFITTAVDILGVLIYFGLAVLLLEI